MDVLFVVQWLLKLAVALDMLLVAEVRLTKKSWQLELVWCLIWPPSLSCAPFHVRYNVGGFSLSFNLVRLLLLLVDEGLLVYPWFKVDPVVYNMLHEDPGNVSYSAVGGLSDQIRELRESIELPLMNPELFLRVGIKPPKVSILFVVKGWLTHLTFTLCN